MQHVGRVLAYGPYFVAAIVKIHHKFNPRLRQGFGLGDLQKIVVILGMEGRHQGDFPQHRQAQGFAARGEGAVGVNDIQGDHAHPFAVMRVPGGFTGLVLAHAGHFASGEIHQLKWIPAPVTGVVHGRDHRYLMAQLA